MFKEMVLEKSGNRLNIPLMIMTLGASMLLAYSTLGGGPSPLNCALAAAVPPIYSAAVLAGSLITYLASGGIGGAAMVLCALLLITVGKWIIRDEDSPVFCGGIAAISLAFSGLIFGLLIERSISSVIIHILLAILMGVSVYFIYNSSILICMDQPFKLDRKTETSAAVVFMLAVSALCSVEISVINIGRIAGIAVILCAAKRFRHSGGVICGVLTTAGIFLSSSKLGLPAAFLVIAGFAAGFAADYSKVSVGAAFLTVNFCGQLLTGMNDASFFLQADAVIGCIVFMLIPEKYIMYGQVIRDVSEDGGEQLVKARMDFVAGALVDVRQNVEDIIKCLEKNTIPFNTVNEVSARVCGKCRNKLICWENNYEKTNACFLRLEKQSLPNVDNFPGGLDHCSRKRDIVENFLRCRKEDAINKMLSARLNESRSFLFSQMETTEGILSSLSDKMNFSYSKNMTQALCSILEESDIEYTTAIAYFNNNDRLIAEIYVKEKPQETETELAEILSEEFHVPMEASEPVSCGGETRYRFNRQTKYTVEFAASQSSAQDGQPSGDSWGFFQDGLGYAYIFISDGMGSGKQAALDSAIVSKLFKRLIKSGIDCSSAVKMINSIMLTKSEEESFATLDIARIDLETCELTLYKSGASSTLIKYDDSVMMFNSPSNPIGIIPDTQIFSRTCNFSKENILVMLSDGVDESLYLYIKEQLMTVGQLETIADNVCESAGKKSKAMLRDDITVAALKIIERQSDKRKTAVFS